MDVPAGFLIVDNEFHAKQSNTYREAFGTYLGVDRKANVAIIYEHGSIVHGSSIEMQVESATIPNTAFIAHASDALNLYKQFTDAGAQVEMLFCEVNVDEDRSDRRLVYAAAEVPAGMVIHFLGYDVSWPTCTHSAILQPGIVPGDKSWISRLNENGLLTDCASACELRKKYLAHYPYPPFDVFRVYRVVL